MGPRLTRRARFLVRAAKTPWVASCCSRSPRTLGQLVSVLEHIPFSFLSRFCPPIFQSHRHPISTSNRRLLCRVGTANRCYTVHLHDLPRYVKGLALQPFLPLAEQRRASVRFLLASSQSVDRPYFLTSSPLLSNLPHTSQVG